MKNHNKARVGVLVMRKTIEQDTEYFMDSLRNLEKERYYLSTENPTKKVDFGFALNEETENDPDEEDFEEKEKEDEEELGITEEPTTVEEEQKNDDIETQ